MYTHTHIKKSILKAVSTYKLSYCIKFTDLQRLCIGIETDNRFSGVVPVCNFNAAFNCVYNKPIVSCNTCTRYVRSYIRTYVYTYVHIVYR